MKVLILTYYWPPAGGSGVQRWLKFVKYLPDFGVTPIVYTVKDPQYAILDESLILEVPENVTVIRESIWEPNELFAKLKIGEQKKSAGFLASKPSLSGAILQYVRANFFIPDARRFWIKPSVKRLLEEIKENKVDLIISTGPPHSLHLIGKELKKRTGIKWVADFRDPWTNIDYFHSLPLTPRARKKHLSLENEVLVSADAVIVVGNSMKEEFSDRNKNVHVITNGFDGDLMDQNQKLDSKFSISHIGSMNADRNPAIFWKALMELVQESSEFAKDLQVKLIGTCDREVYQSVEEAKLNDYVHFISYLPHDEVLHYQRSSHVLLIAINKVPSAKSILTGKVFEYLQSGRPVIGIGPGDGDLSEILKGTGVGQMIDFEDLSGLKEAIKGHYHNFKSGEHKVLVHDIEQYQRKNLTAKLVHLIRELLKN